MINIIFILLCLAEFTIAQSNGEFWWLNNHVKELHGVDIPPAKFEQLNQYDNDENDKVVFGNDIEIEDYKLAKATNKSDVIELHFPHPDKLVWPEHVNKNESIGNMKINSTNTMKYRVNLTERHDDEFRFHFPDDTQTWNYNKNKSSQLIEASPSYSIEENVHFKPSEEEFGNSENICSYLEEIQCQQKGGFIYKHTKRSKKSEMSSKKQLVCCILPLKVEPKKLSIVFPDTRNRIAFRYKRSSTDDHRALNQRKNILDRGFYSQYQNYVPITQSHVTKRIVTHDEDYEDPYANIKNIAFKTPVTKTKQRPFTTSTFGYNDYDDTSEDYADELPKPGLVGLYSYHGTQLGSWTFANDDDDDDNVGDEYDDVGYGVSGSTIDPRLDRHRPKPTQIPNRRKTPSKYTSTSEETDYRSGSETISYQSNPDFKLLQGFKLLNLVRNKSRIYTKNSRNSSTESVVSEDSPESLHENIGGDTSATDFEDLDDLDKQVFKECGKFSEQKAFAGAGETRASASPWLLLVGRSRRRRSSLCHATLLHPRAALTAASCVYGAVAGELVVYAGLWDIGEDNQRQAQQRLASAHVHPRYSQTDVAHDLAILHWSRPLRLGHSVQPACLGDPHVGDSCSFAGWGGQGKAINPRPRTQRASIVSPRECSSCLNRHQGARMPSDAFCATVDTPGCVTSTGGSLICNTNGRPTSVGVVIWREGCDVTSPVVLLPARDWVRRALSGLGII